MTDLAEFLLVRIAEDEAAARERSDDDFYFMPTGPAFEVVDIGPGWVLGARPDRVLAECKAKRQIVKDLRDELANQHDPEPTTLQLAERTLLALALPYGDHEDYRKEWRS